jgi:pimeloyl-ACP methyl ester carboxylesterase
LIHLVSSQSELRLKKERQQVQTARELGRNGREEELFTRQVQLFLAKKKQRFLSDDLYEQEDGRLEEQAGTVRLPPAKTAFGKESNSALTSKLWRYRAQDHRMPPGSTPCLFLQAQRNPETILLYFHGNGEDIIGCAPFLQSLSQDLAISVLAMEYPGYSGFEGSPTVEAIEQRALEVLELLLELGFRLKNVVVLGRSIGSGPALLLASLFEVGAVALLSPFLSLREAVSDLYGRLPAALLKAGFDNKERAREVSSPCLIVHGTKDRLISERHSSELAQFFRGYCRVQLLSEMSHSSFSQPHFFGLLRDFCRGLQII